MAIQFQTVMSSSSILFVALSVVAVAVQKAKNKPAYPAPTHKAAEYSTSLNQGIRICEQQQCCYSRWNLSTNFIYTFFFALLASQHTKEVEYLIKIKVA